MRELETPSAELAEDDDIATIVALHAREGAWRPAVIDGDRRVDWREHGDRIHQFANALIGLGIQKGDRVATLGRNRIEYQEAFLGTLLAGGCAVPLPTMASPEALRLMLEDSGAKVLVVTADYREAVAAFVQELAAIVDEAGRHDIPVSCHAHGIEVIIAAIKAGCRSIEHASYIDDEGLRLMKEHNTLWIPNYISTVGFQLPHDDYTTTIARQRAPHILENLQRMIRRGHEMGITILTAVDTSYGAQSIYRVAGEINAFIEFGMTPIEALRAATITSAEAYGLGDQTGVIEAGLDADLVVFDRDPLLYPSVLHNALVVISNGRIGLNRHVGLTKVLPNY